MSLFGTGDVQQPQTLAKRQHSFPSKYAQDYFAFNIRQLLQCRPFMHSILPF